MNPKRNFPSPSPFRDQRLMLTDAPQKVSLSVMEVIILIVHKGLFNLFLGKIALEAYKTDYALTA